MKIYHSECKACDFGGKMFESEDSLERHEETDHREEENGRNTSFVFSESMLDKFL